jgi:hypothetical protein
MQRRETFGTSGPRMKVRFFGSFDYAPDDVKKPDFVKAAYAKGVPMGGDSEARGREGADVLVMAHEGPEERQPRSDPDRQGMDRRGGKQHEKIYDVSSVGDRKYRLGREAAAGRQYGRRTGPRRTRTTSARRNSKSDGPIPTSTPGEARVLLRPRPRDPTPALEHTYDAVPAADGEH